jgi:hypothetical protein
MNRKSPRAAQALLQFEQQEIWLHLPISDRDLCRDLLMQMLIATPAATAS